MSFYAEVLAADAAIDEHMGERARITPWIVHDYDAGIPDPSRSVVEAVGVFILMEDTVASLGGTQERTGSGFITRMIEAEAYFSVAGGALGDLRPQKDDRVEMLDQTEPGNQHFVVSRALPDASKRWHLHLTRVR